MKTIFDSIKSSNVEVVQHLYCLANACVRDEQKPNKVEDALRLTVLLVARRMLNDKEWMETLRAVERVECDTDFCVVSAPAVTAIHEGNGVMA